MRDNTLSYTLTTPDGDVLTLAYASNVWAADCEFQAGVRAERSERSQRHGSNLDAGLKSGGVWSATLNVLGSGATLEANRTAVLAALNGMLAGGGSLAFTNQGATTPLSLTGLYLLEDPAFKINGSTWSVQVMLGSERPFAEDASATTIDSAALSAEGSGFAVPLTIPFTLVASSGGEVAVNHVGDFPRAYPLLQVWGPITDPMVFNQTTGESLVFTGSIGAGDYWEIDLFERTVKLNGSSPVRALDVAVSEWWAVKRGVNTLQVAGAGFSNQTKLRALMRSAWA